MGRCYARVVLGGCSGSMRDGGHSIISEHKIFKPRSNKILIRATQKKRFKTEMKSSVQKYYSIRVVGADEYLVVVRVVWHAVY